MNGAEKKAREKQKNREREKGGPRTKVIRKKVKTGKLLPT
jgi:hypothetical protein